MLGLKDFLFFTIAVIIPVGLSDDNAFQESLRYLSHYGYLDQTHTTSNLSITEVYREGLERLQRYFGLNVTGRLDHDTEDLLRKPRCGVTDFQSNDTVLQVDIEDQVKRRRKRFSFYDSIFYNDILDLLGHRIQAFDVPSSRWRSLDLSWRISKYPARTVMSRTDVDRQIREAFRLWSDVTDLTFSYKVSGAVHIDIQFHTGSVKFSINLNMILSDLEITVMGTLLTELVECWLTPSTRSTVETFILTRRSPGWERVTREGLTSSTWRVTR